MDEKCRINETKTQALEQDEERTDKFHFPANQQYPGSAISSRPCSTAATVGKGFGIGWRIKLDNNVDMRKIKATCGHISGQKNTRGRRRG